MRYTIQLLVERKVLICGDKQALLGHHMADKMLAALIDAANRSQSLRAVELMQLWRNWGQTHYCPQIFSNRLN